MSKSTKQLARELGFLRKRPLPESPNRLHKKQLVSGQIFSYLIIIDFESTCWENDKHSPQEIIEFPAVLMNTKTGQIESEFHYYLQPTEMPFLSNFCQQLTGITQIQVDNGIPLNLCLKKFTSWLNGLLKDKGIVCANDITNNSDHSKKAAFVTWSDWDLGVCLLYEIKRKQILRPSVLDRWIDLRATYRNFYSRKPDGLNGALRDVGIEFDGREHSGLDDARNTARLAWRMICDGCILTLTKTLKMNLMTHVESPYLQTVSLHPLKAKGSGSNSNQKVINASSARDKSNESGQHMKPCHRTKMKLSERNLNISPHLVEVKKAYSKPSIHSSHLTHQRDTIMSENVTADHRSILKLGSKSLHLPSVPVTVVPPPLNTSSVQPQSLSVQSDVNMTSDQPQSLSVQRDVNMTSDPKFSELNLVTESPVDSSDNSSHHLSRSSDNSPYHLSRSSIPVKILRSEASQISTAMTSKSSTSHSFATPKSSVSPSTALKDIGHQHSVTPQIFGVKTLGLRAPVNVGKILPVPSSFKTPNSDKNNSSLLNKSSGVNSSFKTPINGKMNLSFNMKATPPLCSCGRRSRRRLVQNKGPNTGRWFFSCSIASSSVGGDKQRGCKFFQWEFPNQL